MNARAERRKRLIAVQKARKDKGLMDEIVQELS